MKHLFPYRWNLSDGYPAKGFEPNGLNVFGTFICGGGSTMGYKLAGFNHLGGVEIDAKIADVYKANHNPKYLFVEDIRAFNSRRDLPDELFNLDILDGSPPCSTFSMAGSREKTWGKEKKFREGQAMQQLDDLVFVYCDTILKLRPKVFLLENVKGLIQGNAKLYAKQIVKKMEAGGYVVQVFLLNAASIGVPQKRERVFFIGYRKELNFPKLRMVFKERAVTFGEIDEGIIDSKQLTEGFKNDWNNAKIGGSVGKFYSNQKVDPKQVLNTIASGTYKFHWKQLREITNTEFALAGTYPLDYNFKGIEPKYLIGMSVPPVMTAQIANQIAIQWFNKRKEATNDLNTKTNQTAMAERAKLREVITSAGV
jgi:DNA (cytosine-5)-methyltransferase 1